jgi:hypothetical protein
MQEEMLAIGPEALKQKWKSVRPSTGKRAQEGIGHMSLPLLVDENPRKALQADRLKVGQRFLHRHFGLGVVTQIEPVNWQTQLTVDFDEEGKKNLRL